MNSVNYVLRANDKNQGSRDKSWLMLVKCNHSTKPSIQRFYFCDSSNTCIQVMFLQDSVFLCGMHSVFCLSKQTKPNTKRVTCRFSSIKKSYITIMPYGFKSVQDRYHSIYHSTSHLTGFRQVFVPF